MATLTLTSVWITLALDLSQSVQVQATAIADTSSISGSVKTMAGGRRRSFAVRGDEEVVDLTIPLADPTTVATLQAWKGQEVLLRDPFGLRVWGVYYALPRQQLPHPNLSALTLKVEAITHDEAV